MHTHTYTLLVSPPWGKPGGWKTWLDLGPRGLTSDIPLHKTRSLTPKQATVAGKKLLFSGRNHEQDQGGAEGEKGQKEENCLFKGEPLIRQF